MRTLRDRRVSNLFKMKQLEMIAPGFEPRYFGSRGCTCNHYVILSLNLQQAYQKVLIKVSARAAGISRLNQQVSTFMHTHEAVGGTHLLHNIVQRIPSVPWNMASWQGSWVLSMLAIKNARKRSWKENQITLLCSQKWLPNTSSTFSSL